MLNRKASNYIFYGMLLAIAAIVLLIRLVLLGNLNARIDEVQYLSTQQQAMIDIVDERVSENLGKQEGHLYDLYSQIPQKFDYFGLSFKTVANLELAGVTEEEDIGREVTIETDPTFPTDSVFSEIQEDFDIIKVHVYFNRLELDPEDPEFDPEALDPVDEFINLLYESEQIFIVSEIRYTTPDGGNYVGVSISFLAFYEKELESEN